MNVRQLIKQLETFDPELNVVVNSDYSIVKEVKSVQVLSSLDQDFDYRVVRLYTHNE